MTSFTDGTPPPERAAILSFPRKRGRPRKSLPRKDTGTPELIMKRLKGETCESLDLCLQRDIITIEQHWCGIHLRWLYTLRHGVPGLRAIDPTHIGGMTLKPEDPTWKSAREKEYNEAMQALKPGGYATMVLNVCVYNERPSFLKHPLKLTQTRTLDQYERQRMKLCEGLDILVKHWER